MREAFSFYMRKASDLRVFVRWNSRAATSASSTDHTTKNFDITQPNVTSKLENSVEMETF